MKKLIKVLPLFGFLIALVMVGVTSSFKNAPITKSGQSLYQFRYVPQSPSSQAYSKANVEDESHWTYDPTASCTDGSIKACTILASQVDDSDPTNPVLLESENIAAQSTSGSNSRVISTADAPSVNSPNISNRIN